MRSFQPPSLPAPCSCSALLAPSLTSTRRNSMHHPKPPPCTLGSAPLRNKSGPWLSLRKLSPSLSPTSISSPLSIRCSSSGIPNKSNTLISPVCGAGLPCWKPFSRQSPVTTSPPPKGARKTLRLCPSFVRLTPASPQFPSVTHPSLTSTLTSRMTRQLMCASPSSAKAR
nr:MAG: hypothetical protein [Culex Bastrovirus-like virus]